ncbi:MAG: SDR family oxidoreductase [Waltera sp.]
MPAAIWNLIVSLNYFGTVAIAKGVYDLLKKKHGSCVVTVSNTISQGAGRKDIVDLLNNIGDEKRVLSLVSSMDSTNLSVGNSLYVSTKYALARWVRRVSATWAANGVRINAVAPGNVHTAMTATMSTTAKMALNALPIPTKYGQECLMAPEEIAEVMVFLASDSARGVNGNIMFVDGGTDALLNSEKVY